MSIPEVVSSALVAAIVISLALLALYGVHRARRAGPARSSETGDEGAGGSWFFVHHAPESRDWDDRGI